MKFAKMQEKSHYFLFYPKCMNADVDAYVRERKKKVLPSLKVVMIVALVSLLCLMFSVPPCCLSFLLTVDVAIAAYCML